MAVFGVSTVSIVTNDGKATLFETSFTNDDNDLHITENEQKNALDVLDRALKDKLGKEGKVLFVPTDAHVEICEGTSRVRHYIPWVDVQQFKKIWIDPVSSLASNPAVRFAKPVDVKVEVKIDGHTMPDKSASASVVATPPSTTAAAVTSTSLPPPLPPAYDTQEAMNAILNTLAKADPSSAREFLVVWTALSATKEMKVGVSWDEKKIQAVANQKVSVTGIGDAKWDQISKEDASKRIKVFVGHIVAYPKNVATAGLFRGIEGTNFTNVAYFEDAVIQAAREKLKVVNPSLGGEFEKIVGALKEKQVANGNEVAKVVDVVKDKLGLSEADAKKTVNGFLSYLQWVKFLSVPKG